MSRQHAVRQTMLLSANKPFQYGTLDCCLFAAEVAKEIEGVDYAAQFSHKSEQEAFAYIENAGGLESLITKTLNREPIATDQLELGDPALVKVAGIELIGVWSSDGTVIVKTERGTLKLPSKFVLKGWKLGTSTHNLNN